MLGRTLFLDVSARVFRKRVVFELVECKQASLMSVGEHQSSH